MSNREKQKFSSMVIIVWLGMLAIGSFVAYGIWRLLKYLFILLFLGCSTTSYTYTVTHENGTEVIYQDRQKAIQYHDKQNFRKPNSVWIDSTKIKG